MQQFLKVEKIIILDEKIDIFTYFCSKHRLLVRVPTIYVLSKNKKIVKISTENCHFYSREKSLYVAWACFRNDYKKKQVRLHSLISFIDVCYTYSSFRLMHTSETEHMSQNSNMGFLMR